MVDILIENATIISMNQRREILQNASVVIEADRILDVGPTSELREQYSATRVIDATGKVLLPGFVNAHTHLSMSLQRGLGLGVQDALHEVMWPIEKSLTAEDCYMGALLGAAEAVKAGATCVVDHYFFMEEVARATTEVGIRGVLGHTVMSQFGPIVGERELEEGIAFVERWKGRSSLVIPWLAPHATDTVWTDWLLKLKEAATKYDVGLHLHLAQSLREVEYSQEQHGKGAVEYLYDIGFLGDNVIAAHCRYISNREMDLLADSGTSVAYCPVVHALVGSPARAWEMIGRGVNVILGTDCVVVNNIMDISGELKIAGLSQKQLCNDPTVLPAAKILEMVTTDAARALGLGDTLGSVQKGYKADLVLVDMHSLHTVPSYNLVNDVVYCCSGRDVDLVIVDGRIVVEKGRLLTVDETEVIDKAQKAADSLLKRALRLQPKLKRFVR
jgi:5-methylthioadenosine/S-adenosylhomocysteine deaminase